MTSLHVWRTNFSAIFIEQPMQNVVHGKLSLTLPPGEVLTLTTTTGQQKGSEGLIVSIRWSPFHLCRSGLAQYSTPAHHVLDWHCANRFHPQRTFHCHTLIPSISWRTIPHPSTPPTWLECSPLYRLMTCRGRCCSSRRTVHRRVPTEEADGSVP